MPFYEREDKILNALLEKESMTTQELSAKLYVSAPTLRRDLIKLDHVYLNNLCHLSDVDEMICERMLPERLYGLLGGGAK